ncbi:MAG: alkaline phosphatase [Deltaproteobacteria bacterium CG_4_10_14_3_um_filter_51_14]|nr:MAG: alkaline phosphatase [Deltaproteobacteria bacterium CG_4_10_14_3_um_filter_51_14]PJB34305.1 MAG: alkaline phosphatase [Deltaproteobacteria bacterium CG_4_9_14_3_um_filter_51_14]
MTDMKVNRLIYRSGLTCLLVLFFCLLSFKALGAEGRPKNIILMIVDGCGAEQYTLARWVKGAALSFEAHLTGAVRTFNTDSVVTDSAPAASAHATGVRTSDKFISMGPHGKETPGLPASPPDLRLKPMATILEGARLKGMASGIVCTSRVTHATPAAFMAHTTSRDMEDMIMEQAVYQGVDIVLGGGMRHLLPKAKGGSRADGEDLSAVLAGRGYSIINTKSDLDTFRQGKAFGLFAGSHMEAELDRPVFAPDQPTLAEMTEKAIEILSSSPNGFFLMVEASEVDWACHANDPAHLIGDLLMLDKAADIALKFAERDGNTLLIVVSDHNTGGMSIGNRGTGRTYSKMTPGELIDPLKKMRLTASGIWRKAGGSKGRLKELLNQYWGIDPSNEEMKRINDLASDYGSYPATAIGEVLSATRTALGWTTHGHTGGDVPLFAYGPSRPKGVLDAPALGSLMAEALGLDLKALTERLFADAEETLKGFKVELDRGEKMNPVLRVKAKDIAASIPIDKNILKIGSEDILLEGVAVHVEESGKTYIPRQAIEAIKHLPAAK